MSSTDLELTKKIRRYRAIYFLGFYAHGLFIGALLSFSIVALGNVVKLLPIMPPAEEAALLMFSSLTIGSVLFYLGSLRQPLWLEFSPETLRICSLRKQSEYNLSELTFTTGPAISFVQGTNRDDVRISDAAGKVLIDIDKQWADNLKLLLYLENKGFYTSAVPMSVRQAEKNFIKAAAGRGVLLFLLVVIMVVFLITLSSFGLWVTVPAILLFAVVFFYLFSLPEKVQ